MYKLGWLQPIANDPNGISAKASGAHESADRGSAGRDVADPEFSDRGSGRDKGKRPRRSSSPSPEEAVPRSLLKRSGAYEGIPGVPPRPPPRVSRHPTPQTSPGSTSTSYLSCPFYKVLPLVRSRRVLLRDGRALLAPGQVPAAVIEHFKEGLRKGMAVAERGLPGVERDERVKEVLMQVKTTSKCGVRLALCVFFSFFPGVWAGTSRLFLVNSIVRV